MISLKFGGAAKTVTGSNYLVKTENGNFVVDCGMFQGPDVEHLNLEELSYDASEVKFVLLTHAHIDHSGMLPKLLKGGFKGPIYSTLHSIQISSELLLDSAKIQENQYAKGEFYGKYTNIQAIVFNMKDAADTVAMFKAVKLDEQFEPVPGIKIKFIEAGHILGSASIEADIEDSAGAKKIIFSGDIGRLKSHILPVFNKNYHADADYVLMESLYGGQIHPDRDDSAAELMKIIQDTTRNRGNVFIPCFAVQRTQEVLNDAKFAKDTGKLDRDIPFWLDSPLAQRVSTIYMQALQTTRANLFDFEGLRYTRNYKQSIQLSKGQGQVIMAGSGMADGGRIQEHLATGLRDPKNVVTFVGFQAEGTLGKELVEGAKRVQIGKTSVDVKAKIIQLKGFSAHGDTNDYSTWIQSYLNPKLKKIFLVHAEPDRANAMKEHFEKEMNINNSYVPSLQEEIVLD